MKKIFVLALPLLLASCATVVKGTTQSVSVSTPPHSGARCTLISEAIGTRTIITPAVVELTKSKHNINVSCKKGCLRGVGTIPSNFEGMSAGNVLLGGVVGLGIDAASGAMNKYAAQVQIPLRASPGCG